MLKSYFKKLFNWEPNGSLKIIFPDNTDYVIGSVNSDLTIKLNNYRIVWNYFTSGPNAFGDCYVNGDIECSDLTQFFIFYLRNKQKFDKMTPLKIFRFNISYVLHLLRWNSLRGARKNIRAHYDMGNNFFSEWLDDKMQYSSAHFDSKQITLEQAQENKFKKINSYLNIKNNEKVLEIGCGWGTLSQYLFENNTINIDAITISEEQLKYARELNITKKLADCNFKLEDYRKTNSKYNKIVSVEMIEAVGSKYLPIYIETIKKCLQKDGHAIIQGITIADERFTEYSRQVDFIQKYIFPGGFLPSKKLLEKIAETKQLQIEVLEDFNQSYVKTLSMWREKFNKKWPRIKSLGYDDRFKRIWNYYLSYCEAGFCEDSIQISIFKLSHMK